MAESVFLAELTWPEFERKVQAGVTVFLPLGATEQHGPHMAMSVDVVLPTAVCERVARNVGGLVAPTIPYGYKSQPRSGGGEAFPGTTSLDANTFSLVVRDVIRSLGQDGVRRLVVVNGHFENCWPAVEGVDLGLARAPARRHRRHAGDAPGILGLRPAQHARPAVPGRLPRHRARACEPARDLADAAAAARPRRHGARCPTTARPSSRPTTAIPCPKGFVPASGVLARAERATAEQGQWLMDDHVELITKAVRAEFRL